MLSMLKVFLMGTLVYLGLEVEVLRQKRHCSVLSVRDLVVEF